MNKILLIIIVISLVMIGFINGGVTDTYTTSNVETGDKVDAVIDSINNGESLPEITYGDKLNTIITNGV